MEVTVKAITVGKWSVNCYLIVYGNEAWIIDPGDDAETIIENLQPSDFKLKGIINTHGHFDHIGAVAEIKEHFQIPFYIHSNDKRLVSQGNLYRKIAGDESIKQTPVINKYLDEMNHFEMHDKKIFIHHTPGHTAGSVCFEVDHKLFSGDLFFKNSIGRTDLQGGNKDQMLTSLRYIFEKFKGFQIYPGHGKPFILSDEIVINLKSTI